MITQIKKFIIVLWWALCDIIQSVFRNQELIGYMGQHGSWIEIPKMFNRHDKEDFIKQKRRECYLKWGRYP